MKFIAGICKLTYRFICLYNKLNLILGMCLCIYRRVVEIMLIPTRKINLSESLLGFGAYILGKMDSPRIVDSLWNEYQKDYAANIYIAKHTFDNLLLTIVFLYSIGVLDEKEGNIVRCY